MRMFSFTNKIEKKVFANILEVVMHFCNLIWDLFVVV